MKMKKFFSMILSSLICSLFFAQNNDIKFSGWKKAETEHFNFIYEEAQKEAAKVYMEIAENAWNDIGRIYAFPQDKTNIYITGRTNTVNAFTYWYPAEIEMFTNPIIEPDFTFRENWQKLFFTHELVHIANFHFEDKSRLPEILFGPFIKTIDLSMVNGWALEGLATVLETELTKGGRGRSPYFELSYKSVTLDNGFISYEDIGAEKEPPYSQVYVMGYLIMKSIADRYGISALADIERNRQFFGSWEKSVELVTGETPQNIYRDVRIALEKKYADERKIPEGIIISPRELKTNYLHPAIINDDGTLITLRSAKNRPTAVVKLNPSAKRGSNYYIDTKPEADKNTLFNETVLFSGSFTDTDAVTADENGTVYATLGIQKKERFPGTELESALYIWNQNEGLKKLTHDVSLFQPSVSRNGKTLVAVEQKGMDMRLVNIDKETGAVSALLEKPGLSFIQPAVNSDGSKIAFLILDDTRARVAVLETSHPYDYQILANDEEKIYDPAYPTWNSDGNLTFCCNYRGRLEIFEINEKSTKPRPVVSDPIGATWAYKTPHGIYYCSSASSGRVIKMKPESEWGKVASFDGPSPAGEIICFKGFESDYPDFKPYIVDSSQKNTEIKHRSPENTEKAAALENTETEVQTVLENEKPSLSFIHPVFYLPIVTFNRDFQLNHTYVGAGCGFISIPPRKQHATGVHLAYLSYYPEINNFTGSLWFFVPIGSHNLDFMLDRNINFTDDVEHFVESNTLVMGYTLPIFDRREGNNALYFSSISYGGGEINRFATTPSSVAGNHRTSFGLYAGTGLEFYISRELPRDCWHSIDFVFLASICGSKLELNPDFKFGFESELIYTRGYSHINYELSVRGRYTPFPSYVCPPNSGVVYGGRNLDCSESIRIVPKAAITVNNLFFNLIDTRLYCEMLFSGSPEKNHNFNLNRSIMGGIEIGKYSGQLEVAGGTSLRFDFDRQISAEAWNVYFTFKYHWCRH